MRPRLRMERPQTAFNIVLVNPEIPQNTGNIARLCAATGSKLHLVGTLGFKTDDKTVRRAGLDYWHLVDVKEHKQLSDCLAHIGDPEPLLFTTGAKQNYLQAPYKPGGTFVFGSESSGLPDEILTQFDHRRYGIPTCSGTVRSLNLANAASIIAFKALEVTGALDVYSLES